jgi:hypothetical protein
MRGGPRETLIKAPHRILHRLGSEHVAAATDGRATKCSATRRRLHINPEKLPVVSIVGEKQYRTNRGLEKPSVLGPLPNPRKSLRSGRKPSIKSEPPAQMSPHSQCLASKRPQQDHPAEALRLVPHEHARQEL